MNQRLVVVIPLRALEGAKSRLGEVLDAEERRDLVVELLEQTVRAATATPGIAEVVVVSADPAALVLASDAGARPLRQVGSGLNGALGEARRVVAAEGATAMLVLPADLPRVDVAALAGLVALAGEARTTDLPLVGLVPDRHGRGTNALLVAPPGAIDFAFGGDSRAAHAALATAGGARYVELESALSLDLDTPEDLLVAQATAQRR